MVVVDSQFSLLCTLLLTSYDKETSERTPDFHCGTESFGSFSVGRVGKESVSGSEHAFGDEGVVESFRNILVKFGFEIYEAPFLCQKLTQSDYLSASMLRMYTIAR